MFHMKFEEHKNRLLKNNQFKQEYEDLEPEYELIETIIALRKEQNITQQELSRRTGIQQAHISRLERGNYNPSLKFLKRIAAGFGKKVHISFKKQQNLEDVK